MSSQLPPTENVPIFDSALFNAGDVGLTYNTAKKNFLTYPSAQGTEQLLDASVIGTLTAPAISATTISFPNSSNFISGNKSTIINITSNYNLPDSYLDTNVYFTTSSTGYNVTIPYPQGRTNRTLMLANESIYTITVNIASNPTAGSSTFLGDYGYESGYAPASPSFDLLPNTNYYFFCQSDLIWNIWQKTGNPSFDFTPVTGSTDADYSKNYSILNNSFRFISSASVVSGILILPRATDINCHSTFIQVFNLTLLDQNINIRASGGVFGNKYGSGTRYLLLPPSSQVYLFCNGTNWQVLNTGSQPLYYNLTLTADYDFTTSTNAYGLSAVYQIFNNKSVSGVITSNISIIYPTSATYNGTSWKFYNNKNSVGYFTINSNAFAGPLTTNNNIIVPINSWVSATSCLQSSAWLVDNYSPNGFNYPFVINGANTANIGSQYYRSYLFSLEDRSYTISFIASTPLNTNLDGQSSLIKFSNLLPDATSTNNYVRISASVFTPVYVNDNVFCTAPTLFPYTLSNLQISNLKDYRLDYFLTGRKGSGTVTATSGTSYVQLKSITNGCQIGVGSVITISSVGYTISAIGSVSSGTLTGTAGSSTVTLSQVTPTGSFITVGFIFIVGGLFYTVTALTTPATGNGGYQGTTFTVSPVIPAGGWTLTAFTTPLGPAPSLVNNTFSIYPSTAPTTWTTTAFTTTDFISVKLTPL